MHPADVVVVVDVGAPYPSRAAHLALDVDRRPVGVRSGERLNAILARARESDKNRVRKNAVAIPQSQLGSYTVAPRSNAGLSRSNVPVDVDIQRRKQNAERLKSLTRKMTAKT